MKIINKSFMCLNIEIIGIFIVVGLIILSIYAQSYLIDKAQRTKFGE